MPNPQPDVGPPALDAAAFRQVIGRFMSGVVVITAAHAGERRGMTVSAISSLSLDPPMIVACLNAASATQETVRRAGAFAVNVLAEHQEHLAALFARPGPDPFDQVGSHPGLTGAPILADTLAVLECRIAQEVRGGSHRVLLADVVAATAGEGSPLAYFRGRFGRIELTQDAEAHQRLRALILTRQLVANQRLDVDALCTRLAMPPSAVGYALTRLVGEHLVLREEERGYVVRPLDAATSDDAHDARMAIELGAAELTVGGSPLRSWPSWAGWPRSPWTSWRAAALTRLPATRPSASTRAPTATSTATSSPPPGSPPSPRPTNGSASPT